MKRIKETAQTLLMQRIRESLPKTISLVDDLADLLKISTDSSYRRIRGETDLSIEEIALVCKHFKISFDNFIDNIDSNIVSFSHHQLNSHVNSFKEYLGGMDTNIRQILKFPEDQRQIVYAAEDIPVFQNFAHPLLTAFKIFYWNKSILNAEGYEDKKFETAHIDKDLLKIAQDIYDTYAQIASIEIWSDDTVNSTIKQVEFYWDSGAFKTKNDALQICEELNLMFARINKQAELGIKLNSNNKPVSNHKNFELYHSDIMIGTNCVMTNMGTYKGAYISYHSFNVMLTTNVKFCMETYIWIKNLFRKSSLISDVAEKQRYRFFKNIAVKMNALRQKIEND